MKSIVAALALLLSPGCGETLQVDGERAFAHLKQQVAFGPRLAGSEAIQKTRAYLKKELESYGLKVEEHRFTANTPKGKFEMVNILASIPGAKPESILLGSHYDTKDIGTPPCPGANDGASNTGLLLEMARQLASSKKNPKLTLRFAFFDGEEAIEHWTDEDSLYGSRELVKKWKGDGTLSQIKAMVLLDMIGDKDLHIIRESISSDWLVALFRDAAKELGHSQYFFKSQESIEDDHRPFLREGVAAINLIDNEYGAKTLAGLGSYWHTAQDTIENCSPKSLQIVGDVSLLALEKIQLRLAQ